MRETVERPGTLVDIGALPLREITTTAGGGLRIGALTRMADAASDRNVRSTSTLWNMAPDAPLHDVTELDASLGFAAGGIVSTTRDLSRFLDVLLRGKLLPPAQHKVMWETVSTEGAQWLPNTTYGTGVWKQTLDCGVTVHGFGGFINGALTYGMGTPDGKHTVVVNLNGDRNQPFNTINAVLAAEFCAKK